jgi:hypothetical protein
MSHKLIGRWANEYGSFLDIGSQDSTGALHGVYTSETGASGTYLMNGWSPDLELANQPISLSVLWKPTDSSNDDSSWNWVSMMSGVVFLDTHDAKRIIRFLHGMVASEPFPAVQVSRPGVYTESLTFRKVASGQTDASIRRRGSVLRRASVTMSNVDPISRYRSATFLYGADGNCIGSMALELDQMCTVHGFVNPVPPSNIQSLTLTGFVPTDRPLTFGLGGFIDLDRSVATLDLFESSAVTFANRYAAVAVGQERFNITARPI